MHTRAGFSHPAAATAVPLDVHTYSSRCPYVKALLQAAVAAATIVRVVYRVMKSCGARRNRKVPPGMYKLDCRPAIYKYIRREPRANTCTTPRKVHPV